MAKSFLPPRGVFVPTGIAYNPQLPPALVLTWIQLRGLAWGSAVTPPFRIQELAGVTGKSQATLYQHMSQLRRMSALSWRSTGQGTIIVSFADTHPTGLLSAKIIPASSASPVSHKLESPDPSSSSPLPQNDSDLFPAFNDESDQDQIINDEEVAQMEEGGSFQKSGNQPLTDTETFASAAVVAYRDLIHLTPNPIQRRILCTKVKNLPLWQETLEHWAGHGWNPRNLTGMLELYARGGSQGCRYCHKMHPPTGTERDLSPLEQTHAAIDALRREQGLEPLNDDN